MPQLLICAWCNKAKTKIALLTASTTHGICSECCKSIFNLSLWQLPAHNFPLRKPSNPLNLGPIKVRSHLYTPKDFHGR